MSERKRRLTDLLKRAPGILFVIGLGAFGAYCQYWAYKEFSRDKVQAIIGFVFGELLLVGLIVIIALIFGFLLKKLGTIVFRKRNEAPTVTTKDKLKLRTNPDTSSDVASVISAGTKLNVLASLGGWYHVQTPDGSTGYVASDYVDTRSGMTNNSKSLSSWSFLVINILVSGGIIYFASPKPRADSVIQTATSLLNFAMSQCKDHFTPQGLEMEVCWPVGSVNGVYVKKYDSQGLSVFDGEILLLRIPAQLLVQRRTTGGPIVPVSYPHDGAFNSPAIGGETDAHVLLVGSGRLENLRLPSASSRLQFTLTGNAPSLAISATGLDFVVNGTSAAVNGTATIELSNLTLSFNIREGSGTVNGKDVNKGQRIDVDGNSDPSIVSDSSAEKTYEVKFAENDLGTLKGAGLIPIWVTYGNPSQDTTQNTTVDGGNHSNNGDPSKCETCEQDDPIEEVP